MINRITRKPPRFQQDSALYFLTFCTYKREPYLHRQGVPEMLIDNLAFYGKRLREITAYTVMPDHIHLLIDVESVSDLSGFLRDFKKHCAKEIKHMLSLETAHVWQRGTMDHCIRFSWTNEDLRNHLQYVFFNSWKHLSIRPKDFRYHDFKEAVEQGWLDINFCEFDESELIHGEIYE